MTDEPIKIRVSKELPGNRRTGRQARRPPLPWIIAALVAAAAAIAVLLTLRSPARVAKRPEAAQTQTPLQPSRAIAAGSPETRIVPDDGKLLWASPTSGPPISLDYAPRGAQAFVFLRPASIAAHCEGEKIAAALGPWGERQQAELQQLLAAQPPEIESLLIAFATLANGQIAPVFRVRLVEPWSSSALADRLPDSRADEYAGQAYRRWGDRRYLLPNADSGKTLVVCPEELLRPLIDSAGSPPSVLRDLERLLAASDADRAATLLVAPKFLEAGGTHLLAGQAAPLQDSLDWLTERKATAVMLSLDWADDFFVELRATPVALTSPRRLAVSIHEQVAQSAPALEDRILAKSWPPYGRKVLARLPAMLRALSRFTRFAAEDGMALLRCYLPAPAGHNLLLAAELLLTESPGEDASGAPQPSAEPRTIDERLNARTSLAFGKETLETALALLAEDVGVAIRIRGRDLQLEGITKNQSLSLEMRNRPAREILLEILLRANPDRTAEGPDDPRQKLVYVVSQPSDDSAGIVVTTRSAAARGGDELPAVFHTPPP